MCMNENPDRLPFAYQMLMTSAVKAMTRLISV